jgi:hypothetical protein
MVVRNGSKQDEPGCKRAKHASKYQHGEADARARLAAGLHVFPVEKP